MRSKMIEELFFKKITQSIRLEMLTVVSGDLSFLSRIDYSKHFNMSLIRPFNSNFLNRIRLEKPLFGETKDLSLDLLIYPESYFYTPNMQKKFAKECIEYINN